MLSSLSFPSRTSGPAGWLWIGLIAAASILLSRAFACVTPFAALATLAAFTLDGRKSLVLVIFVWIANQTVGFGLLHYPCTASTIAWGVAIGIAALTGLAVARDVAHRVKLAPWGAILPGLVAAFGAYELVLAATTWLLPSGPGAFAPLVVLQVLAVNAAALALLLAAHALAQAVSQRGRKAMSAVDSTTSSILPSRATPSARAVISAAN